MKRRSPSGLPVSKQAAQEPLPILSIMGPTGSGKTAVALQLAERFPIEIVSVDSALVYRGLDVGSAKPSPVERARVPHHLIDICEPDDHYSAARFRDDATDAIEQIRTRGRLPVLVGGTGLYFRALEHGLAELPSADAELRATLKSELDARGPAPMHEELSRVDPEAARRIHPNDPQRVLRALEVFRMTGKSMSTLWRDASPTGPSTPLAKFAICPPRDALHAAIADRFRRMLERGFVNEVIALRRQERLNALLPAMRSVGYRAVWDYLDGTLSYAEMVERGIIATRQLAKRQITWLRGEHDLTWCTAGVEAAIADMSAYLKVHPDSKSAESDLQ